MPGPHQDNSILDRICIAMPCSIDWESMQGNEEVRLCGGCNKNVYDISAMSKKHAQEVLSAPQLPCIRINRAHDGRVIHDECPSWWKPFRNSWRKSLGIAVSVLTLFSIGSHSKANNPHPTADKKAAQPKKNIIVPMQAGVPIEIKDIQKNANLWPAAITALGFPKGDLPSTASEKFSAEQINAIDKQRIAQETVPPQLDMTAWNLFYKARKLHLKASMHFVNKESGKAMSECQESLKLYQLALEQIARGKHDDAFAAFVYQEQNKIRQFEERCAQCQGSSTKEK